MTTKEYYEKALEIEREYNSVTAPAVEARERACDAVDEVYFAAIALPEKAREQAKTAAWLAYDRAIREATQARNAALEAALAAVGDRRAY